MVDYEAKDPSKILIISNGKILRFTGTDMRDKTGIGKHVEIKMSKMLYDPKYGNADKIEDFSIEFR